MFALYSRAKLSFETYRCTMARAAVLLAASMLGMPSFSGAQFGTVMPGYSGSSPAPGVQEQEQGWSAEIHRVHTETLERQHEMDRDLASAGSREQPVETVESAQARSFFLRLDMAIDPKLVEEVRLDPRGTVKKYLAVRNEARKAGKFEEQRDTAVILGHIYYLTGLFEQANSHFNEVLRLFKDANDMDGQALMISNLGAVSAASGNYKDALKFCQDALISFKATGNSEGQGRVLNNLAILSKNQGRFGVAVTQLEDSLKVETISRETRLLRLDNLARVYSSWGRHQEAVACLNEAMGIAQETADPNKQVEILLALGEICQTQRKEDDAVARYKQALSLAQGKTDKQRYINYLIGTVYLDRGELALAEPFIKDSKYPLGLGRLSLLKGDFKAAKDVYERVRVSAIKDNRPREIFSAYTGLGKSYEAMNDLAKAEHNYGKSVEAVEDIRTSLLWSERRNFFSVSMHGFLPADPAKGLIRVRLKRNKADQTILPSEVTRAREFVDRIAQRSDVKSLDAPPEIIAEEERLGNTLASLKKARDLVSRDRNPERFDKINAEIRTAEKHLKVFQKMLRKDYQAYAVIRSPEPVTLKTSALRPNEYVLLLDVLGDGIGVRLLKGKNVLLGTYEPWNAAEFSQDIESFLSCFRRADLGTFNEEAARKIFAKLLSSCISLIPKGSPITIIPDGELALIPFEALVVQGEAVWDKSEGKAQLRGLTYVADLHPITYYESITALTVARRSANVPKPADRVLVVADPVFSSDDERIKSSAQRAEVRQDKLYRIDLMSLKDVTGVSFDRLPLTGELATRLRALYPGRTEVLEGIQAQKQALMKAPLSSYGVVVCATHGYYGEDIPGVQEPVLVMSLVPTGVDGFLRMSEVMGLTMNAEVVVLTACQTGLGARLPGEGIMSMGRAFQYAGARSVLMSLWSVAEESSVSLTENFFKYLKEGKTALEAIQLARANLRKDGYDHPFYWAPFILVGETWNASKD